MGIKSQSCISLLGPTYKNLPPHLNVCPVLGAFADKTPCLPDARKSYSAALPRQYGEGCYGRNRTMFFVMPRSGYYFWQTVFRSLDVSQKRLPSFHPIFCSMGKLYKFICNTLKFYFFGYGALFYWLYTAMYF